MKFEGGILLVLSAVLALSDAKVIPNSENVSPRNASSVFCQFEHYTAEIYACFLTVENPDGLDNFESIGGEHQPGMTNANVSFVFAVTQNTRSIPRIICQTFPNTVEFYFSTSHVEFITEDTFAGCRAMEYVNLNFNSIRVLPARVFAQNVNLRDVELAGNEISIINPAAFEGNHQISYLDLGANQINAFNPVIFRPLGPTLNFLYLYANRLTNLPFFAFGELTSLIGLDIGINNFTSIPGNVFYGLMNLTTLYMDETTTRSINADWFMTLFALESLQLHYNYIREIPPNAFNNLVNIQEISLFSNRLEFVHLNSFGASINNLTSLYLSNNRIEAFDEQILDNAGRLNSLYFANNLCASGVFFDIPGTREQTRTALQACIRAFIGNISCNYFQTSSGYLCNLGISNIVGQDFETIGGTHLAGQGDANVTTVSGLFQRTRNIPGIICRQFPNVESLRIEESQIEVINEASFAGCASLWYVRLDQNNIVSIPDNTFRNNPNLQRLYAVSNLINHIGNSAFTGSGLTEINLEDNMLTTFNPTAFGTVGQTLYELFLFGNQITTIPPQAFSNFPVLDSLYLNENPIGRIPSNAFRGLHSLTHLELDRTNIQALDPEWFADLIQLTDLRLANNQIRRLPNGIFNNLVNLWVISLNDNQIRNINANSFGRSLDTLLQIYSTGNGIRSFDREIINRASNLSTLQLNGNNCVNQNFFNVQGNLENVRTSLSECFRMFDGFVSCEYVRVRNDYICHMTIQNPKPNDDFYYIPGNHMTGMFDVNITVLDAMRQDTMNIPPIICRQFPNLQDLYIDESHVEFIDERAFEYCTNLQWLDLYGNAITSVPDFTFSNNPSLHYIYFLHNEINHIAPNAFLGTNLQMLDFDLNRITELDRRWLQTVSHSLEVLYVTHNNLTTIQENTFDGFTRLDFLSLGYNQIRYIPGRTFSHLTTLRYLWLNENRLLELNPEWFDSLRNLVFLSFYRNLIEDIPAFAFNNLPSLREVDLAYNRIRMIHSDAFGASASSIAYFFIDFNLLDFVDVNFFNSMTNLQYFYTYGNKCVNRNFFGVQNNQNSTRLALQSCFENFERSVPMNCIYMDYPGYDYTCFLAMGDNIAGNDNIEVIEGEHTANRTNNDVLIIESFNQHVRTFPSVICRQFPNLNQLWLSYSGVQTFRASSLAGCVNLRELIMEMNPIHVVPAGIFTNNLALQSLWLDLNKIYRIEAGAFNGTSINSLGLAVNELSEINLGWFDGIANTVEGLYLYANYFTSAPERTFSQLTNLRILDIGLNHGFQPPSNALEGLTNLQEFYADDNQLTQVHPEWFTGLSNLAELRLHRNNIHEIHNNTFEPLTSLRNLVIGENPLRFIGAEAFGNNPLNNLTFLSLVNSVLHAFDEQIFNRATNLQQLYLYNNPCVSMNFYNVSGDRENIRGQIQQCMTNFVGTIGCQFIVITGYPYMCELSINNAAGRDNFNSIPGNHVGANTNANVLLLEGYSQRTRNFPSILCQTFMNVEEIYMPSNEIMHLEESSFTNCVQLNRLTLSSNNIHSLPANLFRTNVNLGWLSLYSNQLSEIGDNAFTGSRIAVIDLDDNSLGSFNTAWFEGINATLETLDLQHNRITEIGANSFDNLRNILELYLRHNQGLNIHSNAFNPLQRIRDLHIDNIGLRHLDPGWFRTTNTLEIVTAGSNHIRRIPDGIFENLTRLLELNLRNNSIDTLSVYQFGFNVLNITNLIVDNNRINAVDMRIFDQSMLLNNFYLAGNICHNGNIRNIQINREATRNLLWTCFDNYGIDEPDMIN